MGVKNQLTDWVIDRIEKEYKEDIALLIGINGHSTDNDQHGVCFDFFVPATERGNELTETFIIDGVGHDLYPRSWERLEDSVQMNDMALLLDQAEILYARSEEDKERFLDLRKRLHENLNDPEFVYGKALEYMDKAMEVYRTLVFEEKSYRVRAEIGYIQEYLSKAVAVLNHTYTESAIYSKKQAWNKDVSSRMYHCPEMTEVPDGFWENAESLLTEKKVEKQMAIVLRLLKTTRSFILAHAPERENENASAIDYCALREWYQELSLTWRRIRYFCENRMQEEAYLDALYLQEELLYVAQEYKIEEMNLLDAYDADDLTPLRNTADELEQRILAVLSDKQIDIKSYASAEEFLAARGGQNQI